MNGVEILASNEVVDNVILNWTAFWICASIIFGTFIIVGIITFIQEKDIRIIPICILVGLFLGIFSGYIVADATGTNEYITEYKVTISDDVTWNEFDELYEIVGREGKIYTVIERD